MKKLLEKLRKEEENRKKRIGVLRQNKENLLAGENTEERGFELLGAYTEISRLGCEIDGITLWKTRIERKSSETKVLGKKDPVNLQQLGEKHLVVALITLLEENGSKETILCSNIKEFLPYLDGVFNLSQSARDMVRKKRRKRSVQHVRVSILKL